MKPSELKQQQDRELSSLKKRGLLRPEDVVKFARKSSTALHKKFEWNDSKASHEYRLWQARELIVRVRFHHKDREGPIQAYVSLKSDRGLAKGGYRRLIDVLGDDELRKELFNQAMEELNYWQDKYDELSELAPIFAAAAKVEKTRRKKPARTSKKARRRKLAVA